MMIKFDKVDNKSRRLRKKLCIGEFTVYIGNIKFNFNKLTMDIIDDFFDEKLYSFLESLDIGFCSISTGLVSDVTIYQNDARKSITENDINKVVAWLTSRNEVNVIDSIKIYDSNK